MSEDLRWSPVGSAADWNDGQSRVVTVGARRIAVFRTGEAFRALKDACPHAGVSLAAGAVHDGCVICPAHAWAFNLDSGRCAQGPAHMSAICYPVRVVGGTVEIGV